MDCNVPVGFLDDFEELDPFDGAGYQIKPEPGGYPTRSVSTFENLCKLSSIADQILSSLYAEKSLEQKPDALLQSSDSLHTDLERWRESLPSHLRDIFDGPDAPCASEAVPHTVCLM